MESSTTPTNTRSLRGETAQVNRSSPPIHAGAVNILSGFCKQIFEGYKQGPQGQHPQRCPLENDLSPGVQQTTSMEFLCAPNTFCMQPCVIQEIHGGNM
ncbi:hypothetical protein GDO78_023298 [Eleutherodactylus coqui]|uniref:Uncharacterized protein n=1 Tax=Eleutherodactylus coqui TaxID=57060 RepID=A0A8J6E2K0_ELECQ|nr:hypothetical protein GDO78_023298 [Eleutherodactylus coqui]